MLIRFIKKKAYIFIFLLISIIISIITVLLYKQKIINSCMEIIPHIITVASIVLGIITLVLTVLISIRDGKTYKWLKTNKPNILEQTYGFAISALIGSLISIITSLLILVTKDTLIKCAVYKYLCAFILSTSFVYMILSVITSFSQSIQMLQISDENE